jgi:hypothetical protein
MRLSMLSSAMTRWFFRFALWKMAYSRESLEQLAARSRFGSCEIEANGIGFELRLAKQS